MTTPKHKYYKSNISKWLLIATLVLSVFAFTGYNANARSTSQQKAQTEQVCSNTKKACKPTAAHKRSSSVEYKTHQYATNILLHHNRQVKIKLDHLLNSVSFIPIPICFIPLKTIPQSSDEDILVSITG